MLSFLLSISDEQDYPVITRIYKNYYKDMIRLAKHRCKAAGLSDYHAAAEDAVQNAFVKLVKYAGVIKPEADDRELKAYVLAVVSNEVTNLLRDHQRFCDIDEHPPVISDEEFIRQIHIRDRYEKVIQLVEAMDDKYSMALLYHYRDEMSVKEIAELMGLPEKTVYTRLYRAQKMLTDQIGEDDDGGI